MAKSSNLLDNFTDIITSSGNLSEALFHLHDFGNPANATLLLGALTHVIGENSSCNVNEVCLRAHPGDRVPYDDIPDCYHNLLQFLPSDTIVGSSQRATWEVVVKTIFYVTAILITIIGNLWVLTTIFLTPKMYIPTYYFLANLAISDLVVGFLCMPLHLARHLLARDWPFGPNMCKIYHAAQSEYEMCCN